MSSTRVAIPGAASDSAHHNTSTTGGMDHTHHKKKNRNRLSLFLTLLGGIAVVLVLLWVLRQHQLLQQRESRLHMREIALDEKLKRLHQREDRSQQDDGASTSLPSPTDRKQQPALPSRNSDDEVPEEQHLEVVGGFTGGSPAVVVPPEDPLDEEWLSHIPCPVAPTAPDGTSKGVSPASKRVCGGAQRGQCDHSTGKCRCAKGYAGKSCDIRLPKGIEDIPMTEGGAKAAKAAGVAAADQRRSRLADELLTIIIGGSSPAPTLLRSITHLYPKMKCFYGPSTKPCAKPSTSDGDAEAPPEDGDGDTATDDATNSNSRKYSFTDTASSFVIPSKVVTTPFVLFISPNVVRLHEHTNLPLAVETMLTTDVDVLGFLTLEPHGEGKGEGDRYLLETPCWQLSAQRWVLSYHKSPFGYDRHDRLAMLCDRVGESFLVNRQSLAVLSNGNERAPEPSLLNGKMSAMLFADFWLRIKRHNVGLINRSITGPTDTVSVQLATHAPTRIPRFLLVGVCAECLLIQHRWLEEGAAASPLRSAEKLNSLFAEKYQIEASFPPGDSPNHPHHAPRVNEAAAPSKKAKKGQQTSGGLLAQSNRLVCVKSGGIYGHSNRGLYSPLCHRYQRQRDFKYLIDLWTNPSALGGGGGGGGRAKRYGVSLHHGNLFGALRMSVELLWETDGDFDLIGFDDDHASLMVRFEALKKQAQKDGFEVRVTYPEKPWYSSFLRDKTDFQLNARSPKDLRTRGKPPQVHNISLWYQGRLAFVNGFQNPWQSIRLDPGHDYREQYLAQQGWVLHYTNTSVGCLTPGHPSCLPSCNDAVHRLDHNYCAPDAAGRRDRAMASYTGRGTAFPAALRDPILWADAEGNEELSVWNDLHNDAFI